MIIVNISPDIRDFVEKLAPTRAIGGMSNLNTEDLGKASRLDFQYTGLYGEAAWYKYRYGSIKKLVQCVDQKNAVFDASGKGDDGFDDSIVLKNEIKKIDVKASHTDSLRNVNSLNLIVPEREFHSNHIYVAAFTIGSKNNRRDISQVLLRGWCFSEDIKDRWFFDERKFCVKAKDLNRFDELNSHIKSNVDYLFDSYRTISV